MNRKGTKYRIFLAAWAISAVLICVGSLIHFHQWKIYGKPLVSEVVISKREQDVVVKVQSADTKTVSGSDAVLSESIALPLCSAVRTAVTTPDLQPAAIHCLANSGLRAPPLA